MKKDRTENIQKIYKKCAKFCNSSLVETGLLFELLQILAHFLYIFCTISVQFPYGAHFLYVFLCFLYVFCTIFFYNAFLQNLQIVLFYLYAESLYQGGSVL